MLSTAKREEPQVRGKRPAMPRLTVAPAAPRPEAAAMVEQVRTTAYYLYVKRGRQPGQERDDWFEAERIVRRQTPS